MQKINEWYEKIMEKPPKFEAFLANLSKNIVQNRFPNVCDYISWYHEQHGEKLLSKDNLKIRMEHLRNGLIRR